MKLAEDSYRWAIKHLFNESDTDLFPRPVELSVVDELQEDLILKLVDIELGSYKWNAARRFVVPKDDVAYRIGTQLHLIDSIVLGAIIYEFGAAIENRRADENTVYSYRFKPLADGTLYANKNPWNTFWRACQQEIATKHRRRREDDDDDEDATEFSMTGDYSHVVTLDISDFYNQIYLHTIENQLAACTLPNQVQKVVKELLLSLNANSSRGVPIGPHTTHLLAELSLVPIDRSLKLQGIDYKRYVDDFVFFCTSEKEARIRIQQLAEMLDKEQRLILQSKKTRIFTSIEFLNHTQQLLIEDAYYDAEAEIIEIIQRYTGGDPYKKINLEVISDRHLAVLSQENIVNLLQTYLADKNFGKLRWFYRRLSQIAIPDAIDYSIEHFEELLPALNDVCLYINSCAENYQSDWKDVGDFVLEIFEDQMVQSNPFYQISLLNLFVYNKNLNHIDKLIGLFKNGNEDLRRKILLASARYEDAEGWIFQLKEEQERFAPWTRRAYIIATKSLPPDQKKFLHQSIRQRLSNDDILESLILKWAK
jgi:retron-type reverse transcriptase